MTSLMDAIIGNDPQTDPNYPHAPAQWTPEIAAATGRGEGLEVGEDHLEALRALQEYYARRPGHAVNLRELHDALDEKFHHKGGMKYLYRLFPGGPVAQGCRLAGLEVPAGAVDRGFGSVA